jgi:hypothetical protein
VLASDTINGAYPHTPLYDMSMPCLRCPVVDAIVPSASRYAIGPSRSLPRPLHSLGRTALIASSSLVTSSAAKRRQKSPAVVGSGIRSAPTAFMYAVS